MEQKTPLKSVKLLRGVVGVVNTVMLLSFAKVLS